MTRKHESLQTFFWLFVYLKTHALSYFVYKAASEGVIEVDIRAALRVFAYIWERGWKCLQAFAGKVDAERTVDCCVLSAAARRRYVHACTLLRPIQVLRPFFFGDTKNRLRSDAVFRDLRQCLLAYSATRVLTSPLPTQHFGSCHLLAAFCCYWVFVALSPPNGGAAFACVLIHVVQSPLWRSCTTPYALCPAHVVFCLSAGKWTTNFLWQRISALFHCLCAVQG